MEKRNFLKFVISSSISLVFPGSSIAIESSNDFSTDTKSILLSGINGKIHLYNLYRQNATCDDLARTHKLQRNLTKENSLDVLVLSQKIIQDFKSNNICIVDGWVLSRTEVSLCGLAASYQFI